MSANTELTVAIISTLLTAIGLIWAVFTFVIPYYRNVQELRKKEEKKNMGPYTKNIIEDAARYYVRPKCSKNDPTSIYDKDNVDYQELDLVDEVEKFIGGEEHKKFLLILADSGMGKTSFVLNYYYNNKKQSKGKRHKIKLVSLGAPDADSYLVGDDIDYENTIIFLDAFDEDTKAINNYQERMLQLFRLCSRYKKAVITCRSQFFARESDIPKTTDIPRIGPVHAGSRKQYEIPRLYLLPFSSQDIKEYLKKRYPKLKQGKKELAIQTVSKVPSLSMRPMLLAYIPYFLESSTTTNSTFSLFELILDGWLERESVWVDKALLREFSEKLAVNIFQNREKRGTESVRKEDLVALADKWNLKIENWKLTGRSLLNRDANDNYKFAHRSIMEFLFVKRLIKTDIDCYWVELTDQMVAFISEYLRWSKHAKLILNKKIKFLGSDVFWKIIDMRQSLSDEKYLEFTRVFDGINFLNLTGFLLSGLASTLTGKKLDISGWGSKFDAIIEKENFGDLSYRKYFSEVLELDIFTTNIPSEELLNDVAKMLVRQLGTSESSIKNAILRKAYNSVYLQRLKNYVEVFENNLVQSPPLRLIIENLDLYDRGIIAIPIFNKENIFMHYVIMTFEQFGQSHI